MLSEDSRYRHVLWRRWGDELLGFVMLNPSTADATEDDPTIRRCIGFAEREGFGGIQVANLFDLRATDPTELRTSEHPLVHPEHQDPFSWLSDCTVVIAAWGGVHRSLRWRVAQVTELAASRGLSLFCLGTTKAGDPRHPLYLRGDAPLVRWEFAHA